MHSGIREYHCDITGRDVVFKVDKKGIVSSSCGFYNNGFNRYIMEQSNACIIDFPENPEIKICPVLLEMKKEVEKESKLVKEVIGSDS